MKTISPTHQPRGFTIWDLLIILVTLAVVVGLFLPASARSGKSPRISCVSRLKQIGLAFRMWSNDNGEKFPMAVPSAKGGSQESIASGAVFQHYLAVSNELNSPKVLACPSDKQRKPTTSFSDFSNRNLSYFIGLDAVETNPQLILSGDRNISTNSRILSGILTLDTNNPVTWTKDMHNRSGNVGLADGSAQQVTDATFQRQVVSTTNLSQRLAIP